MAHELAHHSDLFVDKFEDERKDSIWFEKGMCGYLPRKIVLDETAFKEITNIKLELVKVHKGKYGKHSLDKFGTN
ncbi:hypothetical protein [Jeotgalibacillus soli]|uniref:Uncharacterized protein n=1 Tax=Jeotgalibacillus soli TaxID=889306 RepID=A0A0C2RQF5_9BACL|nr:hypothetical protein [Jeotgalibacillus soli]KIL52485.1 hypothetical protein KP78_00200 [Jeotgalibacillus soli]